MSQLNLFTALVTAVPGPKPVRQAVGRKAVYSIVSSNDDYLSVCHLGVWIGSLRALSGSLYCLYFPGERGVCGFGGPTQKGAAAELHRRWIEEGRAAA